jgi:hypothetical protein
MKKWIGLVIAVSVVLLLVFLNCDLCREDLSAPVEGVEKMGTGVRKNSNDNSKSKLHRKNAWRTMSVAMSHLSSHSSKETDDDDAMTEGDRFEQQARYEKFLAKKAKWRAMPEDEKKAFTQKALSIRRSYKTRAPQAIRDIIMEEGVDEVRTKEIQDVGSRLLDEKYAGTRMDVSECGQTLCTVEFVHEDAASATLFREKGGADEELWLSAQIVLKMDDETSYKTYIGFSKTGTSQVFNKVNDTIWAMLSGEERK